MNFNKLLLSSLLFTFILFISACGSDSGEPSGNNEATLGKDNLYGDWVCVGATFNGAPFNGIDTSTVLTFNAEQIESKMLEEVLGSASSKYDFKEMKIVIPNQPNPLFDIEVFEKEKIVLSMVVDMGGEARVMKSTWNRKK